MLASQHTLTPCVSYLIHIEGQPDSFACDNQQNVLQAMQRVGRKGIAVGCRGGGCGACRVRVVRGDYRCERMSRDQVSEQEQRAGIALACKIIPQSDLHIAVLGLKPRNRP